VFTGRPGVIAVKADDTGHKMHVLYYHQYFTDPAGIGGRRSYEMAKRLVERGHKVTMVCGSTKGRDTGIAGKFRNGKRAGFMDGFKVIEFDLLYSNHQSLFSRSMVFFRFALKSIGIALYGEYDIVFSTSTPLTAGIPGILAKIFRKKPFIFEVRDLWPELPREMGVVKNPLILKAMDMLEWISYHKADACIGLSPGIVEGITRRGVGEKNVIMIPNGCDLDLFNAEPYQGDTLVSPKGDDFIAVYAGTHGVANGLHAVLDAAAELKKRKRRDIKFVFVGDGKLKPELKKRAENQNLDSCIFLDPVPKKQLASIFRAADAGMMILDNVSAFYYGTSPNKFFDYIAAGLPVINNYPGWIADMITEDQCGLVVSPADPAAFADALEYMADNSEIADEMGRNARKLAERSFDREKLADIFVDSLEAVYSRTQGAA
jgi:glycosyltransferase involved in cell wall biosynthesis